MTIKLWLDDERDPRSAKIQSEFGAEGDEVWVKTAHQAIVHLRTGNVASISLDHDLGPGAENGYVVAKWIEEHAHDGTLGRVAWSVHSMNAVGAKNMTKALTKAEEFWNQNSSADSECYEM